MKQVVKLLIGPTLLCFVYAGAALGTPVKIDPADYTGQWTVDYGPAQSGAAVVDLGAPDPTTGAHVISLGGAELFFDVADDGTVSVARNPAAATGGVGTLTFNNVTVFFHPASFAGQWEISAGGSAPQRGPGLVTLPAGLSYYGLKVGSNGAFSFDLDARGTVSVHNEQVATGGFRRMRLNNTEQRFRRTAQ